jgi:hypothetical protein
MAFRKKDRPIYVANVHYFGDVEDLEIEPEDLDIRAWLDVPEPQEILPRRSALVALIPMIAPYHLFMNANAASGAFYSSVDLLRNASAELLKGESSARSYTAEGKTITVGGAPMFEFSDTFGARIPRAISESEGKSQRIQEFALMERRGGGEIWSRSRAPEGGGQAFFANSGLMLLIQHVARNCDYANTVVPIAAGLAAFVHQFESYEAELNEDREDDMTEENWAAAGEAILRLDWNIIGVVAYADDPTAALAETLES